MIRSIWNCGPLTLSHLVRGYASRKIPSVSRLKIQSMNQEDFAKKHCLTFEEYSHQYGELVKERGLDIQEVYKKTIENSYNNYLHCQRMVDPGRIF